MDVIVVELAKKYLAPGLLFGLPAALATLPSIETHPIYSYSLPTSGLRSRRWHSADVEPATHEPYVLTPSELCFDAKFFSIICRRVLSTPK